MKVKTEGKLIALQLALLNFSDVGYLYLLSTRWE